MTNVLAQRSKELRVLGWTEDGARSYSELFKDGQFQNNFPHIIKEVRGKGLLIGLVLHKNQTKFINDLIDNKLLTVRAAENVVRLLPPLNVSKKEINLALKIITNVCKRYK